MVHWLLAMGLILLSGTTSLLASERYGGARLRGILVKADPKENQIAIERNQKAIQIIQAFIDVKIGKSKEGRTFSLDERWFASVKPGSLNLLNTELGQTKDLNRRAQLKEEKSKIFSNFRKEAEGKESLVSDLLLKSYWKAALEADTNIWAAGGKPNSKQNSDIAKAQSQELALSELIAALKDYSVNELRDLRTHLESQPADDKINYKRSLNRIDLLIHKAQDFQTDAHLQDRYLKENKSAVANGEATQKSAEPTPLRSPEHLEMLNFFDLREL